MDSSNLSPKLPIAIGRDVWLDIEASGALSSEPVKHKPIDFFGDRIVGRVTVAVY